MRGSVLKRYLFNFIKEQSYLCIEDVKYKINKLRKEAFLREDVEKRIIMKAFESLQVPIIHI